MFNRYEDGQRINEEDSAILGELILRHPDEKTGVGIDFFYRDRNPEQPTSCFHIMRTDGQWTDFSYPRCIKGTPPTAETYYYRACRFAVSLYLTEAKNDLFAKGDVTCASSGESVSQQTSEYRHTEPKFKVLTEEFQRSRGIEISMDLFTKDSDRQYNIRFKDAGIAEDFVVYHKTHASLSIFKKD